MEDTGFYVPPEKADRLAAVHSKMPGLGTIVIRPSQSSPYLEKPNLLLGGSNMVSTARDYARFLQMIMNNGRVGDTQYLKAETVQRMTTNQLPKSMVDRRGRERRLGQGFGLGFAVRVELSPRDKASRVGEFGWGGAANTYFFCDKIDDMFVVLIRQSMPMSLGLEAELKPLLQEAVIHTEEEQAELDALEQARQEQQEKSREEQRKQLGETLAKIDAAEIPIDYSSKHHQEWVDRMQGELNSRGRGVAGSLWREKRRLEPELENKGQYYAKILDFLSGIPRYRSSD